MTTTPTQWLDTTKVNQSSAGFQGHQAILGLSNGNVLITFSDDSETVGPGTGRDIVGIILDANGGVVRDLFQVNQARSAAAEESASIAATSDGGFVMAYESRDSNGQSIILERFDANGNSVDNVVVQADPGTPLVLSPDVTVDQSDNSIFVSYQYHDGDIETLRGKAYDGNLNVAAGTPANGHLIRGDDEPTNGLGVRDNESAVLTNGSYVTVYTEPDSDQFSGYKIEFRLSDGTSGANAGAPVEVTSGVPTAEYEPDVAALAGGGFVVVWRQDNNDIEDNVQFRVYNNAGVPVSSIETYGATANNYTQPRVIGLEDGGFYIVAMDQRDNKVEGARFDASGTLVGDSFAEIQKDVLSLDPAPEVGLTTDGRILVTYQEETGNIVYAVRDPRDPGAITADPGDGQITAGRAEFTITDSTITGSSSGEKIFGGAGNDTVSAGGGADTFDFAISRDGVSIRKTSSGWEATSSQGLDRLFQVENFEFVEGVVSAADPTASGLVFLTDSSNGRFIEGGETYSGPVASLERQLVMSNLDENVNGTASNDFINSRGGVDGIDAKGGNDVLDGGTGSNFLTGGPGADTFFTDARIPGVITWSTITDYDAALEEATIFGWTPGISSGTWVASSGAAGFEGATFHADVDGNGLIDTSITFTGLTQDQIQTPTEFDGLLWFV